MVESKLLPGFTALGRVSLCLRCSEACISAAAGERKKLYLDVLPHEIVTPGR